MSHSSLPKLPLGLLLALAMALMLAGCNDSKKIAVVDAEAVFKKSKLAAAGMKHIDGLNAAMQIHLGKMQEELLSNPGDTALEQRLQTEVFGLQTKMDEGQRAVAEKINELFDKAVEDYRKGNGFEVVLPRQLVMASAPEADITDKVVELMDKQVVDFSGINLGIENGAKPEGNGESQNGESQPDGGKPAEKPAAPQSDAPAEKPVENPGS